MLKKSTLIKESLKILVSGKFFLFLFFKDGGIFHLQTCSQNTFIWFLGS